jgi:hypothetical protein
MNEKPRYVEVTDAAEKAALAAAGHDDNLSCPSWIQRVDGSMIADADELRLWRATRQSDVEAT